MHNEKLFPRMVHEYYVSRLRQIAAERADRLKALRSRDDAERYCARARRKVLSCFRPLPSRTDLNVRITGTLSRKTYTIEKLTYESRPGFLVTANVYTPRGPVPEGGFPAVLGVCGHSENAKAFHEYQGFAQSLARKGYVCLIFDPISQGERRQYRRNATTLESCCFEHNMAGKQMSLYGDFFGRWRALDGIRSLDVLLARPDVDRSRIGVTGVSGGGTMASYLHAIDPRFTMAAPACFITTYAHNLENELPTDSEQVPPGILASGLDLADLILARAPRPVLLMGQREDYFDPRGLKQAYAEIRHVYDLLGKPNDVQLFIGANGHGYHQDSREAMYGFFNRVSGKRVTARESRLELEPDEALFATPQGRVKGVGGNRLISAFAADRGKALAQARKPLSMRALQTRVTDCLQLPARTAPPHYRVLRSTGDNDRTHTYSTFWTFAVETEPGILGLLRAWDPQDPMTAKIPRFALPQSRQLTLYLPHVSSRDDVLSDRVPAKPPLLYSLDVRGMGMSEAMTCKDFEFFAPYGSDYMYASLGLMLNESYLGRRVHDVLATLDLLAATGAREIHLIGRGMGAILATFAALLHPVVKRVTLKHALTSYTALTEAATFDWPLSALPRDVLSSFDLPDCYQALRSKRLKIIEPWGAQFESK
ncbi:MAG: acetylxylan esterase [Verrucomicrobia bacterium]|nr:acetylxylan esterase [Verrucomicrobiota bacterium]